MRNEQRGGGVGFHHIDRIDMRSDTTTPEGFSRDSVAIISTEEYELLLRVSSEIGMRTNRSLVVLKPQYQAVQGKTLREDMPLDSDKVRVIKEGRLYDRVFEPIRQMREDMIKEGTSEDVIERTISDVLEADIAELNERSEESQDDPHDALR